MGEIEINRFVALGLLKLLCMYIYILLALLSLLLYLLLLSSLSLYVCIYVYITIFYLTIFIYIPLYPIISNYIPLYHQVAKNNLPLLQTFSHIHRLPEEKNIQISSWMKARPSMGGRMRLRMATLFSVSDTCQAGCHTLAETGDF